MVTIRATKDDSLETNIPFRWTLSLRLNRLPDDKVSLDEAKIILTMNSDPLVYNELASITVRPMTREALRHFPEHEFAAFMMRGLPNVVQVLKINLVQRMNSVLKRVFGFPDNWSDSVQDSTENRMF